MDSSTGLTKFIDGSEEANWSQELIDDLNLTDQDRKIRYKKFWNIINAINTTRMEEGAEFKQLPEEDFNLALDAITSRIPSVIKNTGSLQDTRCHTTYVSAFTYFKHRHGQSSTGKGIDFKIRYDYGIQDSKVPDKLDPEELISRVEEFSIDYHSNGRRVSQGSLCDSTTPEDGTSGTQGSSGLPVIGDVEFFPQAWAPQDLSR